MPLAAPGRWEEYSSPDPGSQLEYRAVGKPPGEEIYRLTTDMWLLWDPELLAIADQFAANNTLFLETLTGAWTTLMNADRFDGPTGNVCDAAAAPPPASPAGLNNEEVAGISVGGTVLAGVVLALLVAALYYRCSCCSRGKVGDNYLLASDSMTSPVAAR